MLVHCCILVQYAPETVHAADVLERSVAQNSQLIVARRKFNVYHVEVADLLPFDRPIRGLLSR